MDEPTVVCTTDPAVVDGLDQLLREVAEVNGQVADLVDQVASLAGDVGSISQHVWGLYAVVFGVVTVGIAAWLVWLILRPLRDFMW